MYIAEYDILLSVHLPMKWRENDGSLNIHKALALCALLLIGAQKEYRLPSRRLKKLSKLRFSKCNWKKLANDYDYMPNLKLPEYSSRAASLSGSVSTSDLDYESNSE